ncbi:MULTISPECIES: hypothetical protein [Haloferax]|uniref:Uncharacterized protein n=1 Tax=Haloferax marinum TaxID=2666143 RepID=A0A6A8G3J0_9EURY|nr:MULTISPECIES: hypothetical protein [Haloferax]KAB1196742.1 hypothetical protein Hfx1150_04075 [Haloferax sp. CBA1150]MRW95750.1 hypothetical protein [Haloferax marinum]
MSLPTRRRFLQAGFLTASVGSSGCLGLFESYPQTGLLLVNWGGEQPRTVVVRVTDTDDETLYHDTLTVPADGRLERENIVDTGPINVSAYVEGNPEFPFDRFFDFAGCRAARPVITVRNGVVTRIGKQDTCRPDEEPHD